MMCGCCDRRWRVLGERDWRGLMIGLLLSFCLLPAAGLAEAKPDWVKRSGVSDQYPRSDYVTGFAMATGDNALEEAKQAAAADLARLISVRIESELSDVSQEEDGEYSYRVAAVTRSTTDVKLSNLHYEIERKWGRIYALAVVERRAGARHRRAERDRAMSELRACLAAAELEAQAERKASALAMYESCRRPIAEALQHDAVANALLVEKRGDTSTLQEITGASRRLDAEIEAILRRPARSLAEAADALAAQIARQGVSNRSRLSVSHFNYGTTNLSSRFGRRAGLELERALARAAAAEPGEGPSPDLAVRGVYFESGEHLRLSVTVSEVVSGRLMGSAESALALSALPSGLEIKPVNFETALRDQRILAEGGLISGDLRLEVWTDRGRGGVLYSEHEELKLYMRVNQTAWIRLIYVLQNGAKVPIDHGYYIDATKVNQMVEYPDSFEVVPPFGIEMIHATAFTERPPRLRTDMREIAGVHYEVVSDGLGSVIRTRGLARKQKKALAEDFVTVTTTPQEPTP